MTEQQHTDECKFLRSSITISAPEQSLCIGVGANNKFKEPDDTAWRKAQAKEADRDVAIRLARDIVDDNSDQPLFSDREFDSFCYGVLEIAETRDEDFELTPEAIAFGMAAMCFATAKLNDIEKAKFWQARFDDACPPENGGKYEQLKEDWDAMMQRIRENLDGIKQNIATLNKIGDVTENPLIKDDTAPTDISIVDHRGVPTIDALKATKLYYLPDQNDATENPPIKDDAVKAKLDDLFNQMAGELLIKGHCTVLTDLHDSKESFAEALTKANRKIGC